MNALPDFDFYNLRQVIRFSWTSAHDELLGRTIAKLVLTAIYENPRGSARTEIVLRCSDVRQLKLPSLGPRFFVSEIEIEDLSGDQIEAVRYRVKDFGESSLEVLCGGVEVQVSAPNEPRP